MSRPSLSGSATDGLVTEVKLYQKECTSASTRTMANVDEYLAHIGYTGSKEPTVANLAALHSCHLLAVVFENISCIIGEKIKLDPDWIFEKIVKRGRGGEFFNPLRYKFVIQASALSSMEYFIGFSNLWATMSGWFQLQ